MKFLHPSQLHWLWLAIIPVVLWLCRWAWELMRGRLSPVGAPLWAWETCAADENVIVRSASFRHDEGDENKGADSTGKIARGSHGLSPAEVCAGILADGQVVGSAERQWEWLQRRADEEALTLSAALPPPERSETINRAWRIVTSQPDVAGDAATRLEILEGMRDYGFSPLPVPGPNNAPAFRKGRMVVWDAHPGNFVMASGGVLVPIDLIITELPESSPS